MKNSYAKDFELVELVRQSMDNKMTYKDAVAWLKQFGYDISEKTYQRIKTKIEIKRLNIIRKIDGDRQLEFTVDAIETSGTLREELLKIVKNPNAKAEERIKAASAVSQNLKDVAAFYDAVPVVKRLAQGIVEPSNQDNNTEENTIADKTSTTETFNVEGDTHPKEIETNLQDSKDLDKGNDK